MPLSLPHLLAIGAAISLALSACGGSAGEASGDASASDAPAAGSSTTEAMAEDEMEDEAMVEDEAAMPSWQTLEITDVNGATFTLADFVGTPVFVENFATWCPNCREQLGKTNQAAGELGDEAVFLALSVETELDPADLAAYATENGSTTFASPS